MNNNKLYLFTMKNIKQLESIKMSKTTINEPSQQIVCFKQKKAGSVCCNAKCDKNIFICDEDSCDCKKNHKKCPKVILQSLQQCILSKMVSLKGLRNKLIQKIDKSIDALSDMRDKMSEKFDQLNKTYGLSKHDKLFLEVLESGNILKLKGINVLNILTHIEEQKEGQQKRKKNLEEKVCALWNHTNIMIEKKINQTFVILKQLDPDQEKRQRIFSESVIIKNEEMEISLVNFFQNKITLSNLLFRASENGYSKDKFYEICSGIPNTLTICQTEFGKVIGGYTPLSWIKQQQYEYITDLSGSSFIFSLTNNDKFQLVQGKPAICRAGHIGPTFGELTPDFYIADKCNSQTSCALINNCYFNENYVHNSAQSREKFSGTSEQRFKIKEWEVWLLEFPKSGTKKQPRKVW